MCCLAWPDQRWNNTALIQIPPSQPVCQPQGGFALAIPPGYPCVLCFTALISSIPSYYKLTSERSSKWGSKRAERQWRVWCLAFETKLVWKNKQNGNDLVFSSCPGFHLVPSCPPWELPGMGAITSPDSYQFLLPRDVQDFKDLKGSGQLCIESKGCPPEQLSTPQGRGSHTKPTNQFALGEFAELAQSKRYGKSTGSREESAKGL